MSLAKLTWSHPEENIDQCKTTEGSNKVDYTVVYDHVVFLLRKFMYINMRHACMAIW